MLSIQSLDVTLLLLFIALLGLLFCVLLDVRLELCYPFGTLVQREGPGWKDILFGCDHLPFYRLIVVGSPTGRT